MLAIVETYDADTRQASGGRLNWEAIGAVGEIAGALAVVLSLVYLAAQVRQNTRQVRGQAFLALAERTQTALRELRSRPEMADMLLRAQDDWDSIGPKDQRIALWWNLDEAQLNELAFVLWQEGAIDETMYRTREEYWLYCLLSPGRRKWWDNYAYYLDPRFCGRINQQLELLEGLGSDALKKRFPMYAPNLDEPEGARTAGEHEVAMQRQPQEGIDPGLNPGG